MLAQYYEILVKNNDFGVVYKIDFDTYKLFKDTFKYVYHTKNGDAYQLDKDFERGIDLLIVDDDHLHELLDDFKEQGFCDTIEFSFIDDYFSGNYNQYNKAF